MTCRFCRSPLSLSFLDLGVAPPSNAYLSAEAVNAPEVWLPLHLKVCEHCWLVQVEESAASHELFTPDYAYFSSFSSSWLAHAERYTKEMTRRFGLSADSLVCEVAANDGYLLQYFQRDGVPCYGIEPTHGTAEAARAKGIHIVEDFFGTNLARDLQAEGRSADLMAANNVLAHVPDIADFVEGFEVLLKPEGVATFEFPHLVQMVGQGQFDTAYHEHFSYLSLTSVRTIFNACGLTVFDVEELPTHGGSLRVYAQRADTGRHEVSAAVAALAAREEALGVASAAFYTPFQKQAERIKDDMLAFLIEAKRADKSVGAYGAAAKGNTLINFAGIKPDLIPFVVDRNPAKQGRFLPGSRIPIVDEAHLMAARPDYIVILPWNLKDEVAAQLAYARDWGAKFVTAVPALTVF